MTEKRYQTFTRHGIEWSPWFPTTEKPQKWQLKKKLQNEYRYVKDKTTPRPMQ